MRLHREVDKRTFVVIVWPCLIILWVKWTYIESHFQSLTVIRVDDFVNPVVVKSAGQMDYSTSMRWDHCKWDLVMPVLVQSFFNRKRRLKLLLSPSRVPLCFQPAFNLMENMKRPDVKFQILIWANAVKTSILQMVCDTTESPKNLIS